MPAAVDVLERRCESAGDSAMARQDLLEELPMTKLGEAVEIDVIAARYTHILHCHGKSQVHSHSALSWGQQQNQLFQGIASLKKWLPFLWRVCSSLC